MRKDSVRELLDNVKEFIKLIDIEYDKANKDLTVREFLKIKIRHAMGDLRSCLDYIANDIYESVYRKHTDKVYFVYAMDEGKFNKYLETHFKDLRIKNEKLYNIIKSNQPFSCNSDWLYNLCDLNNINKHEKLLGHERKTQVDLNVLGFKFFRFENVTADTNVRISGNYFNGIRQKDDMSIAEGKFDIGNNGDIACFDINSEFFYEGTNINCIELLKEAYQRIEELTEDVYNTLNNTNP